MALYKKINKVIDASIQDFCKTISTKYNVNEKELYEIWCSTNDENVSKKPKKKSGYVEFQIKIRPQVKEEMPHLNFGEISKEISKRWKALSTEEKNQYKDKKMEDNESSDFHKMNLKQLRNLCKQKGIQSIGNKAKLIDFLNEQKEAESELGEQLGSDIGTPHSILSIQTPKNIESTNSVNTVDSNMICSIKTPESIKTPDSIKSLENIKTLDSIKTPESIKTSDSIKTVDSVKSVKVVKNDKKLKIGELRKLCQSKGLNDKGNRKELLDRLNME
jgi:hypothetical protein